MIGCACGSGKPPEPREPRGSNAQLDAGVAVVAAGPTDSECDALVEHAVRLGLAELTTRKPTDPPPTTAEVQSVVLGVRSERGCKTLARDTYRCAMAAKTLVELESCTAKGPQPGP